MHTAGSSWSLRIRTSLPAIHRRDANTHSRAAGRKGERAGRGDRAIWFFLYVHCLLGLKLLQK